MSAPYSPVVGYVVPTRRPHAERSVETSCDVCVEPHEVHTATLIRAADVRPGRHCDRCDEEL